MKKDTNALVEQKSVLAKLMASENITVEHKKIPTAAFDIKNRVLYLPILKWKPGSDVYDLFCSHEVGLHSGLLKRVGILLQVTREVVTSHFSML
jgi:hypothetical protein